MCVCAYVLSLSLSLYIFGSNCDCRVCVLDYGRGQTNVIPPPPLLSPSPPALTPGSCKASNERGTNSRTPAEKKNTYLVADIHEGRHDGFVPKP